MKWFECFVFILCALLVIFGFGEFDSQGGGE